MRNFKLTLRATTGLMAFAALAVPGLAVSQDANEAQAETERVYDPIIVRAQKRDQSLEDVPISITTISGDQLRSGATDSLNDLQQLVTAMRVDLAGGFSQPTIRGVGSSIAGAGFSSNVATYVDGFYMPSQLTTDMQLLNVDSIQVLKGPQGTLFGRNATGGAVLVTTRDPSFEPQLRIRGSYASFNKQNLGFYGSTGLSDSLAVDLAIAYDAGDGFVDNIVTGADDDGKYDGTTVRASALWNANDSMKFELALSHAERDDPYPTTTGSLGGLSIGSALPPAFGVVVASGYREVSNTSPTGFTAESDGIFLTSTFDLGWAELVSYTMARDENSRSDLDLDGSSLPVFDVNFVIDNQTYTQELNLSGGEGALEWMVGGFYYSFDEDYLFAASAQGSPFATLYNLGSTIEAYAVFGDLTYQFSDQWFLTGGVRYSREESEAFFNLQAGAVAFGLAPAAFRVDIPKESWEDVSPRVVLRYEPDENSSIYASYSKGFKAGLLAPSSFSVTPIDQESIDAFEVGYKRVGDRVRFDGAVYYYDYKDLQLASYNGVQAIVNNAADSSIWGAEAQISALLGGGLEGNLGVAYTNAEYDNFPDAPIFNQDLNPLLPDNVTPNPGFGLFPASTVDASGFSIQRTPEFTATMGLNHSSKLAGGELLVGGTYYYTSEFFFDPAEQFKQDSYGVLNLRAAWSDPSDHWTLGLFATNILDEEYLTQVLPGQFAIQQTYAEPASVGVSIDFTY